jgi:hypothetical protein
MRLPLRFPMRTMMALIAVVGLPLGVTITVISPYSSMVRGPNWVNRR